MDIDKASYLKPPCNLLGCLGNSVNLGFTQGNRWQGAARVARVNTGLFDVFHNSTDKELLAIEDGIDVNLDCIIEETVNQ